MTDEAEPVRISTIPFTVRCHDVGLEVHNTGSFKSSSGRELKVILKCPVCQQWWSVLVTMSRIGNEESRKRQALYRINRNSN
jgi:hypothetical protein